MAKFEHIKERLRIFERRALFAEQTFREFSEDIREMQWLLEAEQQRLNAEGGCLPSELLDLKDDAEAHFCAAVDQAYQARWFAKYAGMAYLKDNNGDYDDSEP